MPPNDSLDDDELAYAKALAVREYTDELFGYAARETELVAELLAALYQHDDLDTVFLVLDEIIPRAVDGVINAHPVEFSMLSRK